MSIRRLYQPHLPNDILSATPAGVCVEKLYIIPESALIVWAILILSRIPTSPHTSAVFWPEWQWGWLGLQGSYCCQKRHCPLPSHCLAHFPLCPEVWGQATEGGSSLWWCVRKRMSSTGSCTPEPAQRRGVSTAPDFCATSTVARPWGGRCELETQERKETDSMAVPSQGSSPPHMVLQQWELFSNFIPKWSP